VIGLPRQFRRPWRHVFLTLATLAIALKILVPPGFMAGGPTNTSPFALVLCTAQGAMVVAPGAPLPQHDGDGRQTPAKSAHDAPCAFAGHSLSAAPPNLLDAAAVAFAAYQDHAPSAVSDIAPGTGFVGPPLPARGPPTLLT
jgi:hypothetical protein